MIRFMDCNYPGVVYTGTEAHMEGLGREGGCPSLLPEGYVPHWTEDDGADVAGQPWRTQEAPAFWAEPE